jgi:hypothetical protein
LTSGFDDEFLDLGDIKVGGGFGYEWNNNGGLAEQVEFPDASTNTPKIIMAASNGSRIQIQVDGVHKTEAAAGGNSGNWYSILTNNDRACIGGKDDATPSGHFPGRIARILQYDRELSLVEIAQVFTFLGTKYNVTVG